MVKSLCMNCYKDTEFLINDIDYTGKVYECTECHEPDFDIEDE